MFNQFKKIRDTKGRLSLNRDKNLLLKFQKGDLSSFSSIYSRFHKPVLKYVVNQIKSSHVAEDLTQDVFLKVYQFRDSYNPSYEPSTWIWTIARNTVYDYLRKTKTSLAVIDHSQQSTEITETEILSTETAETLMIEELEKQKLLNLMTSLSAKQKEAIFLRMVKKFSYQEISKTMNLSLSAVKSLINRGKNSLVKLNSEFNAT
jgi:RNA polymerase sigma-70 factor (ECF subfamily)